MKLKYLFIRPEKPEEKLEAVKLWEVRWLSRHGEYAGDTEPEIEVFTSKEDAETFKKALEDAFKLIKHTSGNNVTIGSKESPGKPG